MELTDRPHLHYRPRTGLPAGREHRQQPVPGAAESGCERSRGRPSALLGPSPAKSVGRTSKATNAPAPRPDYSTAGLLGFRLARQTLQPEGRRTLSAGLQLGSRKVNAGHRLRRVRSEVHAGRLPASHDNLCTQGSNHRTVVSTQTNRRNAKRNPGSSTALRS